MNRAASDVDAFFQLARDDRNTHRSYPWASQTWLHLERQRKAGRLGDMHFDSYEGPTHLRRFLRWIDTFDYGPFPSGAELDRLVALSAKRDKAALQALGVAADGLNLENIGRYNAQDFVFQRALPTPARNRMTRFLDFGAGHGRMANLLTAEDAAVAYTAVDATPAFYLGQRDYFRGLGLELNDCLDDPDGWQPRFVAGTVDHVPSWRIESLPDGGYDMICAVQVLKELSRDMLAFALGQFHRLLRPGGALYIRDHIGFHNPNAVDLDQALARTGFVLEWRSWAVDRRDCHGVPRIWRKAEDEAVFGRF